jgi:hypothetical protein
VAHAPAGFTSAAASAPAPKPSFVIPLTEAQTHPAPSPIRSESTDDTKPKRKGWWTKVLES